MPYLDPPAEGDVVHSDVDRSEQARESDFHAPARGVSHARRAPHLHNLRRGDVPLKAPAPPRAAASPRGSCRRTRAPPRRRTAAATSGSPRRCPARSCGSPCPRGRTWRRRSGCAAACPCSYRSRRSATRRWGGPLGPPTGEARGKNGETGKRPVRGRDEVRVIFVFAWLFQGP